MGELVLNQPQDWKQLQPTQIADTLSLSLLFSLRRQYLDVPFDKATFIQPIEGSNISPEIPHFLRLVQVGDPALSSLHQPFTALQTALSACHAPGSYTLIFVVTSDGQENRIYLGVRGHSPSVQPYAFVDYLGHFLEGNWPGTRLERCDYKREIEPQLVYPMTRRLNYATALTGIPSLKPGDHPGYPQSLDRMLRGMRGKRFMYMIVAEPMNQGDIEGIIYQCRDLTGRVHTLTKQTLTETSTKGTSVTEGWTETQQESQTYGTSESQGSSNESGFLASLGIYAGSIALATVFPPAALLAFIGGDILSEMVPSSEQESWGKSQSKTTGKSTGRTQTKGFNFSEAQAWGKEYINTHAQAAEAQLQEYIARFDQARALKSWNVGVYFLAEDADTAQQGGAQLGALLSGDKSRFEPIRIHNLQRVWTSGSYSAQLALNAFEQPHLALVNPNTQVPIDHPLGSSFNGLTTPLNTEELALLVNLPRREVPGVQVMPTADFSLNPPAIKEQEIKLGFLLEGGEPTSLTYGFRVKTLAKHALVTGITGSGKSTTCQKLLSELQQRHIPYLVIEPAKDEYVDWAMQINDRLPPDSPNRIAIYIPGIQTWRGRKLEDQLTLNPFDIVWLSEDTTPQILPHVDRLKSILNASFPMQEILPVLLEEALFYAYSRPHNWLDEQLPPFGTPRPTFTQLLDQVQLVVKSKGYEERITANLSAALKTRIQSLRQGWKGKLLDRPNSTPWAAIFDRPAIINLSHLGDDADKAFTMAVLLQFLYEYRQVQQETASSEERKSDRLRHLTVIEEAHRLLLRATPGTLEQANPQAKVAEMFANILSEIRAYGEGLLIADQVPARLVPDAIKNTNLKIVHRLVAADDREAMSACMTLTPEQSAIINRLRLGQAIIYGEQADMASWVQILKQD